MLWWSVLTWYGLASVFTMIAYWRDKRAARRQRPRTRETTLHALAMIGGWPGALLAQRLIHHKSRKKVFVLLTIMIAICHLAITWLLLWAIRS